MATTTVQAHGYVGHLSELAVHVPCLQVRGPVMTPAWGAGPMRLRQHCRCEGSAPRWPRVDVSRAFDLCQLCARDLAGGTSRWSWLVCEACRSVLTGSPDPRLAFAPVGRHSIMNQRYVRLADDEATRRVQTAGLLQSHIGWDELGRWGDREAGALAAELFPGQVDVPLERWWERAPAGAGASRSAARRFGLWLDDPS